MTAEIHLCTRCAAQGPTCCQGKDRDIYITRGDLKRISVHVGQADFYEFRKPTNPTYCEADEDPLWTAYVFRRDGSRRVLKHQDAEGDCAFLTVNGCTLPVNVRPLICRLHPFAYNSGGLSAGFAEGCPTHLLVAGQSLIQCLGMDAQVAKVWHRTLYSEILLEKNNDHWTDLRPAI